MVQKTSLLESLLRLNSVAHKGDPSENDFEDLIITF